MKSTDLLNHLRSKLKADSDRDLGEYLGFKPAAMTHWQKQTTSLTALQIANVISQAQITAKRHVHENAVQPIIEFFPIQPVEVGRLKKRLEVFVTKNSTKKHLTGLHKTLSTAKSGIYIFYDTRGRALYVGQTKKQNLWKELNLAFNRDRSAQVVTLVNHPTSDVEFKSAHEKVRQPTDKTLKLHNLARYFSAFNIVPEMVDDFEAFLIRAFPNDLLNFKMEKFGKSARKLAAAKAVAKKTRSGVSSARLQKTTLK